MFSAAAASARVWWVAPKSATQLILRLLPQPPPAEMPKAAMVTICPDHFVRLALFPPLAVFRFIGPNWRQQKHLTLDLSNGRLTASFRPVAPSPEPTQHCSATHRCDTTLFAARSGWYSKISVSFANSSSNPLRIHLLSL
jgi:hypothetical protein